MQVVSLEPEIRWMPQWSVDKQVTTSGGELKSTARLLQETYGHIRYSEMSHTQPNVSSHS